MPACLPEELSAQTREPGKLASGYFPLSNSKRGPSWSLPSDHTGASVSPTVSSLPLVPRLQGGGRGFLLPGRTPQGLGAGSTLGYQSVVPCACPQWGNSGSERRGMGAEHPESLQVWKGVQRERLTGGSPVLRGPWGKPASLPWSRVWRD